MSTIGCVRYGGNRKQSPCASRSSARLSRFAVPPLSLRCPRHPREHLGDTLPVQQLLGLSFFPGDSFLLKENSADAIYLDTLDLAFTDDYFRVTVLVDNELATGLLTLILVRARARADTSLTSDSRG